MVCERWCVTKLCVWDGRRKMVGDKVACERWCVTKLCEWDGVGKMVCDKVVCVRWSEKDGGWQSCVWKMMCVTKLCEWDGVWQRWVERTGPHTKMWGKTRTKKRGEKNEKKNNPKIGWRTYITTGRFFFPGICVLNCEGFTNGTRRLYNSFWNSHLLLG